MKHTSIVVVGTRGIPDIMGGIETHVEELFPRIVQRGFDVTVIRRSKYVRDDLKEWHGVKLVDVASPNRKCLECIVHSWSAIWKAWKLGADIVHVHAIGPAMLIPLARLLGMRVVFTHHGPDYNRDKWGSLAKLMLRLGERVGCRFANDVIVISDVIQDLIARKYHRTRNVHLVYNGVPAPDICDAPEYFRELGIEKGRYVLGMCRFVPEKHLHDLVEAFVKLKLAHRIPADMRLVLAGDTDFEDDYSRSLKQLARDNDVVLTGFVRGQKLHSLLSNAVCYALPSSHEGLPIALLEAMSYHLPVIASAIPANLEVGLDPDAYHQVGDIDALSSKLSRICSQPLSRIHYDMSKYNWDVIADQVAAIYSAYLK